MHRLFLLPREHILDKYPVACRGVAGKDVRVSKKRIQVN